MSVNTNIAIILFSFPTQPYLYPQAPNFPEQARNDFLLSKLTEKSTLSNRIMSLSNQTISNANPRKNYAAGFLGILFLINGGLGLTVYTLYLQNSCHPLLEWTDVSGRQCSQLFTEYPKHQSAGDRPSNTQSIYSKKSEQKSPFVSDKSSKSSNPKTASKPDEEPNKPSINNKEIIAIAAGSTLLIALTLIGTPFAIAAGVGGAVWYAAKTLM
jgi:hypothetical protein